MGTKCPSAASLGDPLVSFPSLGKKLAARRRRHPPRKKPPKRRAGSRPRPASLAPAGQFTFSHPTRRPNPAPSSVWPSASHLPPKGEGLKRAGNETPFHPLTTPIQKSLVIFYEAKIQRHRHDLLGLLGPCGEGRQQAGRRPQGGGQPDDQLHDGGLRRERPHPRRHHPGGGPRGLRGLPPPEGGGHGPG